MPHRGLRQDLAIILAFFILAVLFFWPVTLGGKTLLPADSAFAWQPWKSYAAEAGVSTPHNALLGDLYLENYAWKRFIVRCLRERTLPLWNPYILSGVPFLAAGQHSAMYPLSALFYLLPLWLAYGWFAALHLFLAGTLTYLFSRTLGVGHLGSGIAGLAFEFSGFIVIRNVFPMIIAAAVWLPLILTCIERIVARAERGESSFMQHLPEMALGAVAVGLVFLAGHPEMYYYVALISAAYALWRLGGLGLRRRSWRALLSPASCLALLAILGVGLGCAQWLPLFDLVRSNFRQGSVSFRDLLGWAYPRRHVVALLLPDFFGNPSHHSYWDPFTRQRLPATINALGQEIDTIFWGIKNYVEGACYVGTLTLLLAPLALLHGRGKRRWFFALLALLALLFAFGSPLYILVFKLPGLNQVHSPFRWIYAYNLCMAMLAGMGADALLHDRDAASGGISWWQRTAHALAHHLPRLALAGGLALLGALALSLLLKDHAAALAERVMQQLAKAPEAFADGRMFYAYQFRNLLLFGGTLTLGGALLIWGERGALRGRPRRALTWGILAALVLVGELFVIGQGFFPAVDPRLVGYRTPAIEFLMADDDLFRITTYVGDDEKPLNANTPWLYDIQDVRGYDSIIPRQYVETMEIVSQQSELLYNRIAPLFTRQPEALEAPLLDMLNVKYVVTNPNRRIEARGYDLVYDGEVRIYRNEEALPRAFWVPQALVFPDPQARREALCTFDPRQVVILEEQPQANGSDVAAVDAPPQVTITHYSPNEVLIACDTAAPGLLVLGDSYAADWLAFIRPADTDDPNLAEQRLKIYRANGNFRAVAVPAGQHVVRFKYSPNSVKFGLYLSFLSGVIVALGAALWGWTRWRGLRGATDDAVQRVAINTAAPIALNLTNKIIDMAFAMLMLRILGPSDAGNYYLAVVVIAWFDILINFGLNTLVTRDVARDHAHASRYLANTVLLRGGLWAASIPILLLFFGVRHLTRPLEPATILAICLFWVGLLPSNVAASLAAIFTAYERMEVPAAITTVTTLLRVTLGTVALVLAMGYVGLAAVSILVNIITLIVLYAQLSRHLFRPHLEVDWPFQRRMFRESYPLMINLLLATLFFKVAVLLLEWFLGSRVVGWYSTAYKYVDAVQLVPAYFTMAIFPLMARYAATSKESLLRAYRLAIKLLVMVALPLATLGWALSRPLIAILGGSQYLPHAAWILRVMVWYMPLGFINSVTQYVLISLEQQRFLTRAFAIGLGFSVLANLVCISRYGYLASAYVAIASELALLVPFYVGVRRHLAPIPWVGLLWKPLFCALPMPALWLLLPEGLRPLGLLFGLGMYAIGLVALRALDAAEREAMRRVAPMERIIPRLVRR